MQAVPERLTDAPWLEITFPRVVGYRYDVPPDAAGGAVHRRVARGAVHAGHPDQHRERPDRRRDGRADAGRAEEAARRRRSPSALAKLILQQHYFRAEDGEPAVPGRLLGHRPRLQVWLFPQVLAIVRAGWRSASLQDDTFPQLLLFAQKAHAAAEKIHRAIVAASGGATAAPGRCCSPTTRSARTAGVSFDTPRRRWTTGPTKCHINLVPLRQRLGDEVCQTLEEMDEVGPTSRTRTSASRSRTPARAGRATTTPTYIVRIDDGRGTDDLLNLVVEVSGQKKKEKEAKVADGAKHVGAGREQPRHASAAGRSSKSTTRGTAQDDAGNSGKLLKRIRG